MVTVPEQPITLLVDGMGVAIKPDVFISPVCRRHYSFPDFSLDIEKHDITLETDIIIVWMGSTAIYNTGPIKVYQQVRQLVLQVMDIRPTAEIWINGLLPIPRDMKGSSSFLQRFNQTLSLTIEELREQNYRVHYIRGQELFLVKHYMESAATGLQVHQHMLKQEVGVNFMPDGVKLNATGWFKLRQLWLQEIGWAVGIEECLEDSKEDIVQSEGEQEEEKMVMEQQSLAHVSFDKELAGHPSGWSSPKTVLDQHDSDRDN